MRGSRQGRRSVVLLLGGALLAGCWSEGVGYGFGEDGSHARRMHHTAAGVVPVPDEGVLQSLQVWVPRGGTHVQLPVEVLAGGAFRVPGLPAGPYYVRWLNRVGTPRYFLTTRREVNLDDPNLLGRPDAPRGPASAPAQLEVHGVEGTGDLHLFSADVGLRGWLQLEVPPVGGSLVGTAASFTHGDPVEPRYPEAPPRDRTVLFETACSAAAWGDPVCVATRGTADAAAHLDAAGALVLRATLAPLPQRGVRLDWRPDAFAALAPAVHPQAAQLGRAWMAVSAAVGRLPDGFVDYPAELVSVPALPVEPRVVELGYGWPYPETWAPLLYFGQPVPTPWLALPGTSSVRPATLVAFGDARPTIDARNGGPFVPRVSPPAALRVDGRDAAVAQALGSLEPELSWDAPRTGRATSYSVALFRLEAAGPGLTTRTSVATLLLAGTRARVPPGLLQPGGVYAFAVSAQWLPGLEDWEEMPQRQLVRADQAHATAVSGLLRAP